MAGGIGGSLTASTVLNASHITLYKRVVVSCHKRAYNRNSLTVGTILSHPYLPHLLTSNQNHGAGTFIIG